MKTKILIVATALTAANAIAEQSAYRCKNEQGKITIQSWPCSGKEPEKKIDTPKPDYPKIVLCGMENGLKAVVNQMAGNKTEHRNCSK